MKRIVGWMLGMVVINIAFANCDLYHFRWPCQLPAAKKPVARQSYTVYCKNLPVYVTKEAYLEVVRYQHANVNMDLMLGDEFIAGPCIPGSVATVHQSKFTFEPFEKRRLVPELYK